MPVPKCQTLLVALHAEKMFAVVELARPDKSNAFNDTMLAEVIKVFDWLDQRSDIRAVIITGQGRHFCAGIDLETLNGVLTLMHTEDPARRSAAFRRKILSMQEPFNAIERCRWPVIVAVQGACIGGGVDMIAACDIRFCSADAAFCVKEVDLAITADLGSLQRLPPLIGHGAAMDLALTARTFSATEAKMLGLVREVLPDAHALTQRAMQVAAQLATKSPIALTGTKQVLLHARDHSIQQGLEYVATWNGGQALSHDLKEVVTAQRARQTPTFSNL